jgi:hypothetical protein
MDGNGIGRALRAGLPCFWCKVVGRCEVGGRCEAHS